MKNLSEIEGEYEGIANGTPVVVKVYFDDEALLVFDVTAAGVKSEQILAIDLVSGITLEIDRTEYEDPMSEGGSHEASKHPA